MPSKCSKKNLRYKVRTFLFIPLSLQSNIQVYSRFANAKRFVFRNFWEMIKPVISVLESDITAEITNRSGTEAADPLIRKRGKEAKQIKGLLLNQTTLLQLAGLAEIYQIFGVIVNVAQVIIMIFS